MKTIALCVSCMFGAIIAFYDTSLFMSSTMWIIVAAIGLLLIIVPNLLIELPSCPLTSAYTCISGFIMGVSFFMAATTFFISNNVVAGVICAILVVLFAVVACGLYSFANDSDERDTRETNEAAEPLDREERYVDDHPTTWDFTILALLVTVEPSGVQRFSCAQFRLHVPAAIQYLHAKETSLLNLHIFRYE